jgi:hypothetical protein
LLAAPEFLFAPRLRALVRYACLGLLSSQFLPRTGQALVAPVLGEPILVQLLQTQRA